MKNFAHPRRQQGAILVIGLVLLLVLTVLGISTMSTASLELSMAGNDQFQENAFQLAETGIDTTISALNNGTPVPAPLNPGVCPGLGAPVAVPAMGGSVAVQLCFQGDIPDITGGSSLGKIRQYHYLNQSQGLAQGQATSFNQQGLFVRGPEGI